MADSAVIRLYGNVRSGGIDYDFDHAFNVDNASSAYQQTMTIDADPSIILARCEETGEADRGATLSSIDLIVIMNVGPNPAIITYIAPEGDLAGNSSISFQLDANRVHAGSSMYVLGTPGANTPSGELVQARYIYAQATTGLTTGLRVTAIGRGPS